MMSPVLPIATMLLALVLLMTSSVGGSSTNHRQPRQRIRHSSLPPSSYNLRRILQRNGAAHDWGTNHARILNNEDTLNQLGLSSWGSDWSTKVLHHPETVVPRHHVSSASNSHSTLPSPASVYTKIYKPSPTIMLSTPSLYYYPNHHDHVHQTDRFEQGPFTSSSNGDKLSEFSRTLNTMIATQNRPTYFALQNDNGGSDVMTSEETPLEEGETILVQSSLGFEVEPVSIASREEVQSEGDISVALREEVPSYIDNRVRELSASVANARFADGNLVEDVNSPQHVVHLQNLFTGSEIPPETYEEIRDGESSTGENESDSFLIRDDSDEFEHIFINDFIDVNQLIQENWIDSNNRDIGTNNGTEIVDEGKSFSSQSNSPKRQIQVIADKESTDQEDSDHKTILLTILSPQFRNKGTKLKGSAIVETNTLANISNSHNLLSMPFQSLRNTPVPTASLDDNLNSNMDFPNDLDYQQDVIHEFDLIGKQIAAMNRIGDADLSDDLENVSAESRTEESATQEQTDASDVMTSSDANALSKSNNSLETLNSQKGNATDSEKDQDIKGKEKNSLNNNSIKTSQEQAFQTEARFSLTAKSKYKQLIPGYQQPPGQNQYKPDQIQESTGKLQSLGSYQPATQLGQNYGNEVTGNQESVIPYQQKYPGWSEVVPYQYNNKDPETGAYSFGYGDQYQWRQEERRPDGVTFGGYGWLDETGKHHVTRFISDARGYRVLEPGQQIDFNVIPVYPPTPGPEEPSFGGSGLSYGENPTLDKESFVTPRPLVFEPVGINFPDEQNLSSSSSSASSQYPLPTGNYNLPSYLQTTISTSSPQTVPGSSGSYPLPTTIPPYPQTLTGTSRPQQQTSSKPNKLSGTFSGSNAFSQSGLTGNIPPQNLGTIGSQISSFASSQNVGQSSPHSSTFSIPGSPDISPSVLTNLYQQVTQQYQQIPSQGAQQYQQKPSQGVQQYQQKPSQGAHQYHPKPSQGAQQYQPKPSQGASQYYQKPSQGAQQNEQKPSQGAQQYQQKPSQGAQQYQQKPSQGAGGSPSLSGSYFGPSSTSPSIVADSNRNYQTGFPVESSVQGSGISSTDQVLGLPTVYRGPIIDGQPPRGNVIGADEKDSDKRKQGEQGSKIVIGRPAISYPLPDNERETNITMIDKPPSSSHMEGTITGDRPPQYTPGSSVSDIRPWTSSVVRIQKPPRSPSLDYAFLTDDDHENVDEQDPDKEYDDISKFLFDLLQKTNGAISSTNITDPENKKFSPSDHSEKDNRGDYGSTQSGGEGFKDPGKLRSDKVDTIRDDVKKGSTGQTVGDYLGTVKFKIPVLGALDGLQQYGDLQVTKKEPQKFPNEKSEVEVIDYKRTRDDFDIEKDDNESSNKNKTEADTKPKSSRPRRPPPPPPLNFFTEFLKQLMMARSDPNFKTLMQS